MKIRFNIENWNRKTTYHYFKDFMNPFAHLGADVDITELYRYVKEHGYSINLAVSYIAGRLCNEIENFRLRIEGDEVYLYDKVNIGQTVGYEDGTFTNINYTMKDTLHEFDEFEQKHIIEHKEKRQYESGTGEGDLIFMTTIPWVSFTSFLQPFDPSKASNPKVAFGKIKTVGGRKLLPVCVEVHHSLMDGYHMGLFINGFERYASNPESLDDVKHI